MPCDGVCQLAAATQVAMWAGPGYLPGMSSHLFRRVLLPIHGVIVSDGEQTHHGAGSFWSDRVGRAVYEGCHAYFVDVSAGTSLKAGDLYPFYEFYHALFQAADRRPRETGAHQPRAPAVRGPPGRSAPPAPPPLARTALA